MKRLLVIPLALLFAAMCTGCAAAQADGGGYYLEKRGGGAGRASFAEVEPLAGYAVVRIWRRDAQGRSTLLYECRPSDRLGNALDLEGMSKP
jgi:hypothetical protein